MDPRQACRQQDPERHGCFQPAHKLVLLTSHIWLGLQFHVRACWQHKPVRLVLFSQMLCCRRACGRRSEHDIRWTLRMQNFCLSLFVGGFVKQARQSATWPGQPMQAAPDAPGARNPQFMRSFWAASACRVGVRVSDSVKRGPVTVQEQCTVKA